MIWIKELNKEIPMSIEHIELGWRVMYNMVTENHDKMFPNCKIDHETPV